MPLPSWISEEFAWLHRELQRLNREIQAFGKRVGVLESVLRKQDQSSSSELTEPKTIQPPLPASQQTVVEPKSFEATSTPATSATEAAQPPGALLESDDAPAMLPTLRAMLDSIENRHGPPTRATKQPVTSEALPAPIGQVEQMAFAPRSISPKEASIDWEKVIGEKWMTWVGGFTLLLAIGFGVQWAWERFKAPPWLQVSGLHGLGIGLLAGGYYLHRRKMPILGQGVLGLGVFTLYASSYAALRLYKLWNEDIAFIEGAAITILAIGVAVRANSPGVILLGALGGYLTPILTSTGSGNYVGLFSYLAFLNVALVACAVWKAWNFVKPLALLATAVMFGLWIGSSHYDATNASMVWGTEWFAVLHALIFLIGSTIPPLFWKRTSAPADLMALTMNSLFFMGFTWLLFHSRVDQQLALVSWGLTALHGLLFGLTYARVTNIDRMPRFHLALAAVFFTLAIPLQIDDSAYWGATWCVQAFIFTTVGVWFRDRQMCASALLVFLLAACRLVAFDFFSPARELGDTNLDIRFVLLLTSGGLALVASGMYRLIPWALGQSSEKDEWLSGCSATISAVSVLLITLAPPLQLTEMAYLGPAWSIEALVLTLIGLVTSDRQLCGSGLLVFVLAAARLLCFDFWSSPRAVASSTIDLRSAAFFWVGLIAMASGAIYRIVAWVSKKPKYADTFWNQHPLVLIGLGALLVTFSPPLQLTNWMLLGPIWATEALLFTLLGICFRDRLLALAGFAVFLVAAGRLFPWDFRGPPKLIEGTQWDVRFVAIAASALIAMLAGALYWVIPRLLRRNSALENQGRMVGGLLLGAGNVALLLSLTCQWDTRLVLIAWTIDVAIVWAAGFLLNQLPTRSYALTLALVMVGGRVVYDGYRLDDGYHLLTNSRFVALALVAALYLAAGWMYRRRSNTDQPLQEQLQRFSSGDLDESALDPLLGVLGNVVLLTALSFEIHSWYAHAGLIGWRPFGNMEMAEKATYSIMWAVYAAIVVAVGFIMRYPLFRILGLAAFAPILLKVFFSDLATLKWLPRVLALAVLGLMLLGVSMLYQKFAARLKKYEEPANDTGANGS